jgi:hypothetical protein
MDVSQLDLETVTRNARVIYGVEVIDAAIGNAGLGYAGAEGQHAGGDQPGQ